jgi:putative MATE family efflux protein
MNETIKLIWDAIRGAEKDFTSGSINRAIILLSIPMILEMLMESTFAVVDIYFVGKIGEDAINTVGLTESVLMLVYSLAIGLAMGATAMVARRIGEKKPEDAAKVAAQAVILAATIAVLIGGLGFFFAEDILRIMGGSEELIATGINYTRIIFATNIVIMLIFLLNGVFRGAGDASIAMRVLWLSNGLNIILDPIFIFGLGPIPAFGVEGAAIATTIGRGTGVLFQLYVLFRGSSIIKISAKHFKVQLKIIWRLIDIGSGSFFQFFIGSASWIFMTYIISNNFSEMVLSGYIISIRVIIFTILPSWGISNAAATLVGQNLGAQQPDRAEKSVWRSAFFNMLFLATVSVIFYTNAEFIIGIFSDEPEVIKAGIVSLKIIIAGYIFFAYGMVLSQSFNGAGDTYTPTVINFVAFWMIQIPLAWYLVQQDFGPPGVYWSIFISESLLALICVYVFRLGRWKKVVI